MAVVVVVVVQEEVTQEGRLSKGSISHLTREMEYKPLKLVKQRVNVRYSDVIEIIDGWYIN